MRARLLAHVEKMKKTARCAMAERIFWGPYRGHEADCPFPALADRLFAEWFCFDYDVGSDTRDMAELAEAGVAATPSQFAYLSELSRSTMRLYEVERIDPGRSVRVRDIITGKFVTMPHRRTSTEVRQWDMVAIRLPGGPESGAALLDGAGIMLPRTQREPLLDEIRERKEAFEKSHPGQGELAFARSWPPLFFQTWLRAMLGPATADSAVSERELARLEMAHFRTDAGRIKRMVACPQNGDPQPRGTLIALLLEQRKPSGELVGQQACRWYDGFIESAWKSSAASMTGSPDRSLGRIEGDEFPQGGRRALNPNVGHLCPADVVDSMVEVSQKWYRDWLDIEWAVLDFASPREAKSIPALRPRLAALLRDMENVYLRSLASGGPAYDPTWMWEELGLGGQDDPAAAGELPPRLGHETMEVLVPELREAAEAMSRKIRRMPEFGPATLLDREQLRTDRGAVRLLEQQSTATEPSGSPKLPGPYLAWLLGHHLDYVSNYDVHYRKAFWVDESLAWMLAQTDLDLDGRQLQLPFSSFCLVYTDRQTLGIAERLRANDPGYLETPRLLRVLTAYVAAAPTVDQAWRLRIAFTMDALDGQWPYLVVRDLWVEPDARLEGILDSCVPDLEQSERDPFFESGHLRELVHLVINSIMYTTSAGAESDRRTPPPGGSRERRGDQPDVPVTEQDILFLPGPIKISEERQAQELQRSPGGGALMKRFMVRGHWRRASANWKDQRPRWIRPYWKGPDIATILERQYRLTT